MSPECEFFVALYDEMVDLRTAIKEKDAIIKQQNLLIEKVQSHLNKVAALLSDHEEKLHLSKSVSETDGKVNLWTKMK